MWFLVEEDEVEVEESLFRLRSSSAIMILSSFLLFQGGEDHMGDINLRCCPSERMDLEGRIVAKEGEDRFRDGF